MIIRRDPTLMAAAIEQADEAVVVTDAEGTILYVNPAFEEITGWAREEAVGRNPRILKSGKHGPDFYREMWETLARGEVWSAHFTNRRKDGAPYRVHETITPVRDDGGAITHYVAVQRSTTREWALEAQLRHAQKLAEVGQLVGGIAHDFNNMLTAIIGSTELLLMDLAPDFPGREEAEEIGNAARRAAELAGQLLRISRQERAEPEAMDVNRTVAGIRTLLRRVVPENIGMTMRLAPDAGAVMAAPGQLEQLLVNLAVNARDAMPEGGELTIATARADLNGRSPVPGAKLDAGSYVQLSVRDTGSGMDAATRARIFEPFFTTKSEGKGTGLGLATVKAIVKLMGGAIHVESAPGRGTTFDLYLPRTELGEAAEAAEAAPPG